MKAVGKRLRAYLAVLLAVTMMLTMIPPTEVMAANPGQSTTTEVKAPALKMLFAAQWYADHNPDVKAAFGYNKVLLYQHWSTYGINEGRQYLSPIVNIREYRAGNADLEKAFGNNWRSYVWHLLNYGIWEYAAGQRSSKGIYFNPVQYLLENPAVWQKTGGNLLAVVEYYIAQGMPAGSWVNHQQTTERTATNNTSSSSSSSSQGTGGGSSGGGSSGGGSGGGGSNPSPNPPTPPKPTPQPTHQQSDPHTLAADFANGATTCTKGCGLTLAGLKANCKIDHSAMDKGSYCLVCGTEGMNEPSEQHKKTSQHTKNSFDETTKECLQGCGLTLTEFQDACVNKTNGTHGALHLGQKCSECDYAGQQNHSYVNGVCSVASCGATDPDYVAPVPHTAAVAHTLADFTRSVDGNPTVVATCITENCGKTLQSFQDACTVHGASHANLHINATCTTCNAQGTQGHTYVAGICSVTTCNAECEHNVSNFGGLGQTDTTTTCDKNCGMTLAQYQAKHHPTQTAASRTFSLRMRAVRIAPSTEFVPCGTQCQDCGWRAPDHTYEDGACTRCAKTCDATHTLVDGAVSCENNCGMPLETFQELCEDSETHEDLHDGQTCEKCGFEGYADHTFGTDGACTGTNCAAKCPHTKDSFTEGDDKHCASCGMTLVAFQAICTNVGNGDHARLHKTQQCGLCDYVGIVECTSFNANSECTVCGEKCKDFAAHGDVACMQQCEICHWAAPSSHDYDENGVCTRGDFTCTGKAGAWHTDLLRDGGICSICKRVFVKPIHPKTDHTKDSFDTSTKKCTVDTRCEYTLDQFQADCKATPSHANIAKGQNCNTCGAPGEKFVCPKGDTYHEALHQGVRCDGKDTDNVQCDYVGEAAHDYQNGTCECQLPCPKRNLHAKLHKGEECDFCKFQGVMLYTEAKCPNGTKHDAKNETGFVTCGSKCELCGFTALTEHDWSNNDGVCKRCGTPCEYTDTHNVRGEYGFVVCGTTCGTCGWAAPEKHAYDANSNCTRCKRNCPNKGDHAALKVGVKCGECGYKGGALYDVANCPIGTTHEFNESCTMCDYDGSYCLLAADHGKLHKDDTCDFCGIAGTTLYDPSACPKVAKHDAYGENGYVDCGQTCEFCGYNPSHNYVSDDTKGECSRCKTPCTHTAASFENADRKCGTCGFTLTNFQGICEHDYAKTGATQGVCTKCGAQCPHSNWADGKCTVCETTCTKDHSTATVKCGGSCATCGFKSPRENHAWINNSALDNSGTCSVCGAECPNRADHTKMPCTQECDICHWKLDSHTWNSDGVKGYCTVCGTLCTHEFVNGTCRLCYLYDSSHCNNGWHDVCHADPNEKCPVEGCQYAKRTDHIFGNQRYCTRGCGAKNPDYVPPCTEADHAKLACGASCLECDYKAPEHNYVDGVCTRCNAPKFVCSNEVNHAALRHGVKCSIEGCDYVGDSHSLDVDGKCTGSGCDYQMGNGAGGTPGAGTGGGTTTVNGVGGNSGNENGSTTPGKENRSAQQSENQDALAVETTVLSLKSTSDDDADADQNRDENSGSDGPDNDEAEGEEVITDASQSETSVNTDNPT